MEPLQLPSDEEIGAIYDMGGVDAEQGGQLGQAEDQRNLTDKTDLIFFKQSSYKRKILDYFRSEVFSR